MECRGDSRRLGRMSRRRRPSTRRRKFRPAAPGRRPRCCGVAVSAACAETSTPRPCALTEIRGAARRGSPRTRRRDREFAVDRAACRRGARPRPRRSSPFPVAGRARPVRSQAQGPRTRACPVSLTTARPVARLAAKSSSSDRRDAERRFGGGDQRGRRQAAGGAKRQPRFAAAARPVQSADIFRSGGRALRREGARALKPRFAQAT